MATKFTFDGTNLLAIAKTGVTDVDIQKDLYSAWKEDLALGVGAEDLSKFPPLFVESIGLNDFGGGRFLGAFFIFNNDAGWRIRAHEADHKFELTGNIYGNNSSLPLTTPTLGDFNVETIFTRSVDAIGLNISGGFTTTDRQNIEDILKIVRPLLSTL